MSAQPDEHVRSCLAHQVATQDQPRQESEDLDQVLDVMLSCPLIWVHTAVIGSGPAAPDRPKG